MCSDVVGFAERRLGKGVVVARDTPSFIANRIGIYGLMQVFRALPTGKYTVEEVDAMTGPAIGRPKSATFRTMDLAGLDVLAHVARGHGAAARRRTSGARSCCRLSSRSWFDRGWTGAKAGRGFYQKHESGEILALDLSSPASIGRPRGRVFLRSTPRAASSRPGDRIRTLFLGKDKVGEFLRARWARCCCTPRESLPRSRMSSDDVDRAMRWGFGWELGPFETLRAIGVEHVVRGDRISGRKRRDHGPDIRAPSTHDPRIGPRRPPAVCNC